MNAEQALTNLLENDDVDNMGGRPSATLIRDIALMQHADMERIARAIERLSDHFVGKIFSHSEEA